MYSKVTVAFLVVCQTFNFIHLVESTTPLPSSSLSSFRFKGNEHVNFATLEVRILFLSRLRWSMIGNNAIRSPTASTFRLTSIIHSLHDCSDIENIDPLPMNFFSTVKVDTVSFPPHSRISMNTTTDGSGDNSISSSSPGNRQLDPQDSDEST